MEEIYYLVTYDDGKTIKIKRNSKTYFEDSAKYLLGSTRNKNNEEKVIYINLEYVKCVEEINA